MRQVDQICRCVFRDGERYADPRCLAFHRTAATGHVAKPDGSLVHRGPWCGWPVPRMQKDKP